MLQIPLWRRILIWAICAAGILFSLPNLFYGRVEVHNDALAQIELAGETPGLRAEADLWPEILPETLVNLGLDLRGGAHLLAEVQVEDVYADRMDGYWLETRDALVAERDAIGFVERIDDAEPGTLQVRISQPEGMETALGAVRALARPVSSLTGVGASDIAVSAVNDVLTVELSPEEKAMTGLLVRLMATWRGR